MLLANNLTGVGDLNGVIYDMEKAGDLVPKHVHSDIDNHITIVARGRLKAHSHDWSMEADAGQILVFRPGEPHELIALEDNTRIINILTKMGGEVDENPR
jgi:quercetin dioxygenase-like cupin family protein